MQELFYLLDSMDSTGRGGVVTTQSLAVELQAGGLTQEHVEYVSYCTTQHMEWGLVLSCTVHVCGVDHCS